MKGIIVYGSEYGTTENYAKKFAEMTSFPIKSYKEVKSLDEYDLVVHFGGLYGGGVNGLKKSLKLIKKEAKLIVVTVGLGDVHDKANTDHVSKSVKRQLPDNRKENTEVFCLRGAIDYSKLTLSHKMGMKMFHAGVKRIAPEKRSPSIQAMLDTYNKCVDYTDFNELNKILPSVQ